MTDYLLLGTFTDEGATTFNLHPERISAIGVELNRLGVDVVDQWAVSGPYDFLLAISLPATTTIDRVVARVTERILIRVTPLPVAALHGLPRAFDLVEAEIPVPMD